MSMRLNAEMKKQVVQKAMDATFTVRRKNHAKAGIVIDKAIWEVVFGAHKRTINALPDNQNWFSKGDVVEKCNPIAVNIAGERCSVRFVGLRVPTKFGYYSHDYIGTITQEKHPQIVADYHAWRDVGATITKDVETAAATLNAMLSKITTYERLEKEWPEGKKFYQSLPTDFPFQHQVPAVKISELNKMLGLAA